MTRRQRAQYWIFSLALYAAIGWFCVNWFNRENLPSNFGGPSGILDWVLFGLVSFVLLQDPSMRLLNWCVTGFIKSKRKALVPNDGAYWETNPARAIDSQPQRVALITTYVPGSEPLSMLMATLKSMLHAKDPTGWTHDVWVLDEGNDIAVQRACRMLGVKYFTRHGIDEYNTEGGIYSQKTKGGNHNAWYHAHGYENYDIVSQFDTDFGVRNDVLLQILPHFADPTIGWVGTPQVYTNTDRFIARGAAEQTYGFYGPFMRGLDGLDMTMLIGGNHTVRVAALKQVSGYDAHLTEDLATGTRLHAMGWRSKYVPLPLAHGEGPTTWNAYLKQQHRWAKGCMDLLFTTTPKRARKMPLHQGGLYLWLQQYYMGGLSFGIGVVLLALSFVLGWKSVDVNFPMFIAAYLPMLLTLELLTLWAQQFTIRPHMEKGLYMRARVLMLAAMPVYLWAFFSAIKDRGKHTAFEVTPKGIGAQTPTTRKQMRTKRQANIFKPHITLATICGVGLLIGIPLGHLDVINTSWAVFIVISMSILVASARWIEGKEKFLIQSRRVRRVANSLLVRENVQLVRLRREVQLYTYSAAAIYVLSALLIRYNLYRYAEVALNRAGAAHKVRQTDVVQIMESTSHDPGREQRLRDLRLDLQVASLT
jgi:cellulose synthase/poly-beta-1,6-N-acetylglucosamine synthase-like glycosyltransferase